MRNNGAINKTRDHFATGQVWTGFGKSTLNCPDSYGTAQGNNGIYPYFTGRFRTGTGHQYLQST